MGGARANAVLRGGGSQHWRCLARNAQDGYGWVATRGAAILVSRRSWPRPTGQAVLSERKVMEGMGIAQRSPVSWRAMTRRWISLVPS